MLLGMLLKTDFGPHYFTLLSRAAQNCWPTISTIWWWASFSFLISPSSTWTPKRSFPFDIWWVNVLHSHFSWLTKVFLSELITGKDNPNDVFRLVDRHCSANQVSLQWLWILYHKFLANIFKNKGFISSQQPSDMSTIKSSIIVALSIWNGSEVILAGLVKLPKAEARDKCLSMYNAVYTENHSS